MKSGCGIASQRRCGRTNHANVIPCCNAGEKKSLKKHHFQLV